MKEVTKENFEELVLKSKKPVVVDMWAPWCQPCRVVGPILEELSVENNSVEFVKCNVDDNPELAQRYSIRGIPTIMYFKEGQLIDITVGALLKQSFLNKINQLYERL